MANNYKGYLLKFGNKIMPNNYFLEYSSTPNQRMDTDADNVDNYGRLHRTVLKHTRTSITFSTQRLTLAEKIDFQSVINSGIVNKLQRKVSVIFWNDEDNEYSTGYFYLPDITYTVDDADSKNVMYQPISVELIEY